MVFSVLKYKKKRPRLLATNWSLWHSMLFSSKKRVKKVKVKRIITITFPFSYFMLSGALCWSFILDSNSFYFHFHSLDFRHSGPLVWNFEFDEVDFFPSLNWIFTACVACKNPVQTRKKWITILTQILLINARLYSHPSTAHPRICRSLSWPICLQKSNSTWPNLT